jgi:hypothetical protein
MACRQEYRYDDDDGLGRAPKFVTKWALGCIAAIAIAGSTLAQTPVERGSYLVNGVLTCGNCHTPRSPDGAWDMSKQLSGRPRTWDEVTFKVQAANITPDLETGIGKWSDADIKRSLLTGVRPNGTQIAPIMPYGFYKVFTPAGYRRRRGVSQIGGRGSQRRGAAGLQGRVARRYTAGCEQGHARGRHGRPSQNAASISSPSGIAWNVTHLS